jgi:MFS family permease
MATDPYAVLKISDFRLLLAGRLCGTVAMQIQGMAMGWQIYALTKSALYLGLIGLSEALPAIAVALYAGHVADVVERSLILKIVISTLFACMALLGICSMGIGDPHVLVPIIFLLNAISGIARGFYGPSVFGMVSDIVPRDLYPNASAWNSAVWQASAVAGPILGGLLYVSLSASNTYFAAAILLFGSLGCFFGLKTRTTLDKTKKVNVFDNITEGIRFVFSRQIICGAMALDLFAVLFGGAVAMLPIFTSEIFHMGPQALGLLRGAPSIGAFLTATFLTHKPITKNAGVILLWCIGGFGLCMIGFGLSKNFYVSLFLLALSGMLDGISVFVRSTIFQVLTPNEMKGRVAAVNGIFIGSSNEIGEFESGITARLMGLVPSVVFGGCMTILVVLFTAIKAPKLRKLHMDKLYEEGEALGK